MRHRWQNWVWLFVAGTSAHAAVNNIVTLSEDEVTNGNCTLREAILATINETAVDACAGDFEPDTIVLAIAGSYDLDDGELPEIPSGRELTVRGASALPREAYVVELSGNQRFAQLQSGATLRLENLEISGGFGDPGVSGNGGGAIRSSNGNLYLRNVRVVNSSALQGGAIESVGSGIIDLERVEIVNNRADIATSSFVRHGGGLQIVSFGDVPIRLVDVLFDGNGIIDDSPGHIGNGGALALYSGFGGDLTLRHVRFERNRIEVDGTGAGVGLFVECEGAGSRFELEDLEFRDNQFIDAVMNDAAAALYIDIEGFPDASIRRVVAVENGSGSPRAQVALSVGPPTTFLASDLLVAGGGGGGLEASASLSGAAMVLGNLTVTGHPGVGITLIQTGLSDLRLENSIVFGNGSGGGEEVFLLGSTIDLSPENLIGIDPGFVDSGNGDFRLGASSVAIDAGDATFASVGPFDLDHASRVVGAAIDLGAFERGAIFADDFEVGDLLAWASTVP